MKFDLKIIQNSLKIIISQQQEIERLNNIIGKDVQTDLYNRRYYSQLEKNLFLDSSILMIGNCN